jgi:nucleoside-diphosphate-sugar epimerase
MKIAITGSTGFVGSSIAWVLGDFGHQVAGLFRNVVACRLDAIRLSEGTEEVKKAFELPCTK